MLSLRAEIIQSFRDRIQKGDRLRLTKAELEIVIEGFIEVLQQTNDCKKIEALCEAEIQLLEEGYPQPSVAKYLTRYRKAITAAVESGVLELSEANSHWFIHQQRVTGIRESRLEHWALTYLKYSPEIYERIDKRSQQVNQTKQLNLKLVPVNLYLKLLRQFLTETGPYEARWLATAIAGLTGRRFAEVMAKGTFSLTDHPYLLRFEGQLKSRMERKQGYDIVTLFPAAEVLEAIQRLRRLPEVQEIAALEGDDLSVALNVFNQRLNTICGKGLAAVVPPLEGKKAVSVHNLRSLYGAIAVYFFCPEFQHEYAFVQHFLGHVMDSPATGHYFRFALGDDQHRPIRSKGILLDRVAQLPLGDAVSESEVSEPQISESEIFESNYFEQGSFEDELLEVHLTFQNGSQIEPQPAYPAVDLSSLQDEWCQALKFRAARLRDEFEERLQAIEQEADTGWFLRRVTTLERENARLCLERDCAVAAATRKIYDLELKQLQAEHQLLQHQLQAAQGKLDHLRRLISASS